MICSFYNTLFYRIILLRRVLGNSTSVVANRMTSPDSLVCPTTQSENGLCWPKCCFKNQVFNLNKMSCGKANRDDILLRKPDIFNFRWQFYKTLNKYKIVLLLSVLHSLKSCKNNIVRKQEKLVSKQSSLWYYCHYILKKWFPINFIKTALKTNPILIHSNLY